MADKTGTIDLGQDGTLLGRLYWEETVNVANNTSTIVTKAQVRKDPSTTTDPTTGTWSYTLRIGESSYTKSSTWHGSVGQSWLTIGTYQRTVEHNTSDGKLNIYLYAKCSAPSGTTMAGYSVSGGKTVAMTTISRASVPTVNTTSTGSTIVSTSPVLTKVYIQSHKDPSTSFRHTVKYAIAGLTNQTAGLDADATTGFANWTSLTPPLSLLNKLTSYSGDKATLTITLNTYTDSTLSTFVGSNNVTFTLTGTGYVEIDNGSSFNNYIAFVDNGSGWDRVVPYIDNGSSWDLY